jgi:hypothetical protein
MTDGAPVSILRACRKISEGKSYGAAVRASPRSGRFGPSAAARRTVVPDDRQR